MSGADFMTKPKHNIRVKRAQDPSSKGAARSVGACAFYSSAVRKATPYVSPEISVTRPVTPWDGGEGKNPHKVTVNTKRKPPLWATWQYTCYRWDAGWNVLGEYDQGTDASTYFDLGARNKTLVHHGMATLAEIDGANPSTGTTRYYAHDHLGSARALYSSAKAELGTLEFDPYGDTYASTGTQPAYSFTGKPYDSSIGMYYFPYRYYSPEMDRWSTRDPLGMVNGPNLYGYVGGKPSKLGDLLGLRFMEVMLGDGGGGPVGMTEILVNMRKAKRMTPREWRNAVRPGGIWDYDWLYGNGPTMPDINGMNAFGNYNYGATGMARGTPLWLLMMVSGFAGWWLDGFDKWRDEEIDEYWMIQGYYLGPLPEGLCGVK